MTLPTCPPPAVPGPIAVTFYQRIGGEAALRPIIECFVARLYGDPMIGFFFARVSQARIEALELQHASEHLGHTRPYRGRPMRSAHAAHRIGQGHFSRRLVILREVLAEAGVAADIVGEWLAAQERERPHIVASGRSPCPAP